MSVGHAQQQRSPLKETWSRGSISPSLPWGAGAYCQGLRSIAQAQPQTTGAHSHTNSATATWQTCTQHPTTSVLTAAVLVYTHGAGITAAAGTRLALQLILITVFGLHPFQVPLVTRTGRIAAVRCCLTRSASALGNLRACCPPW